jgi:hypothetical protein
MAGQQINHHARMRRIEVLDQYECHAGAEREGSEQPPGSIEAAGRGAEPGDREVGMPERRARQTPAGPQASRFALMRMLSSHSNARSFGITLRRSLGADMRYT